MNSNRALRALLLSLLLLLGSFTAFFIPSVSAEPDNQRTELYFTDFTTIISNILLPSDDDFYGEGLFPSINITSQMSTSRPTEEDSSSWPPKKILSDNTNTNLTDSFNQSIFGIVNQDLIEVALMWAVYTNPELVKNFTQGDPTLESLINQIDFELINPFKINEDFTYEGDKPVNLTGKIYFEIYLKSKSKLLRKDNVKVSISTTSSLPLFNIPAISKEIKNATVPVKFTIRKNFDKFGIIEDHPRKQIIELDLSNESILVEPGDTLRFSVELLSHKRAVTNPLLRLFGTLPAIYKNTEGKFARNRYDAVINKTFAPFRKILWGNITNIFDTLDELSNFTLDGENYYNILDLITFEEYMAFLDGITGSSFYFASKEYPSRIILPANLRSTKDNQKTYYLHQENFMDEIAPTNESSPQSPITNEPMVWNTSTIPRNKIMKEATAALYINARNLRPFQSIILNAALVSGGTTLANTSIDINDRLLLNSPNEPYILTFSNIDKEIVYGNTIGVSIATANALKIGQKVELNYDSPDYASEITITYEDTDNIQLNITSDPENALIIPNEDVEYTLNIESKYDDLIDLEISEEKIGDWSYSVDTDLPLSIKAGETKEINIILSSDDNTADAYGDTIDLTFTVSGNTGIDTKTTTAVVDEQAIEYNIGVYGQDESKKIKKGNSGTFYFIIENKNTGAIDDEDSYSISASSKNDWQLKYTDSTPSLTIGEKTGAKNIFVRVYVPENTTLKSDVITVIVTSDSNAEVSKTITVKLNVEEPSIFETIVDFFKSASKSLGLDDLFGSKAPYALAGGLGILILLILIILIYLLVKKSLELICIERIQEIDASKEAVFDITIKNPTRKTKTYTISSTTNPSTSWQIATDVETLTIPAKSSKDIVLVAKPTEAVEPNDWTEITVKVNVSGKKKSKELTTMAMVKDGQTILQIKNVFTWPKIFTKGDRINTSFILENKGNISARNVNVVLFINGKEKNKVEVTIPPGGYAEIKLPWIAVKGKNDLQIKAIEQ